MLLRYGSRLGLSIRAFGNKVEEFDDNGEPYYRVLTEGFTLYGWDIVISPSSTIAMVEKEDVESAMLESINSMINFADPAELEPIKGYLGGLLLESDNPQGKLIYNQLSSINDSIVDDGSQLLEDDNTYGYEFADYAVGSSPELVDKPSDYGSNFQGLKDFNDPVSELELPKAC